MRAASFFSRMLEAARRFGADRKGNVALIFGLAAISIAGVTGAGLDYNRATSVRTSLQTALDSTALKLAKSATSDTGNELQRNAQAYFASAFNRPDAQDARVAASYNASGVPSVTVTGSALVATQFMGFLGYKSITVNGTATATWGMTRLRVALVLDNTGSMAESGKMAALKIATANLLSQLRRTAAADGDVEVSIVPFVKDVRLDPSHYNADWIYWGDPAQDSSQTDNNSWEANNGVCSTPGYGTRSRCIADGGSGSCSVPGKATQRDCEAAAGVWTPGTPAIWTPASHDTWNGCVMDRGEPRAPDAGDYDTNVIAPATGNDATLWAAEQYPSCPQAAVGLSHDWFSMAALVNAMSPAGNTNQAIGLQVGWMSLVGGGPFAAPAMEHGYIYRQVIILLTDGFNTQDRWYSSESSIDNRQSMTCTNIKNAGVTLYTIQVDTDHTPTATLLETCASDPSKFFLLTSADQIVSTFNQIGTDLSQLYISQ